MLQFLADKSFEAASNAFGKEFEYSKGNPLIGEQMELVAEISEDRLIDIVVSKFRSVDGVFSAVFTLENNGEVVFEKRLSTSL